MYRMRTKTMIGSLAAALAALSEPTWAAGDTASFATRHHGRQTHHALTLPRQAVSGVIPRAIRGGNLLQMLNPLAPAKYGTAEENVSLDPEVPGKGNGIDLFSISF
jgi:hypothetical protein